MVALAAATGAGIVAAFVAYLSYGSMIQSAGTSATTSCGRNQTLANRSRRSTTSRAQAEVHRAL